MPTTHDSVRITETLTIPNTGVSAQTRDSVLVQDDNKAFPIGWTDFRVWDAYQTNLPGTAAADDLALVGGTFGTAPPMIQAGDVKALGATTRYARVQVIVPECYVAGETLTLVLSAGMKTTVADVSCTLDVEAYRCDKISGISADLCTTAAQSINSLTFASKTFVITAATFSAGDILDVRITIASNDAATATAVIPTIAGADLVCDIKG